MTRRSGDIYSEKMYRKIIHILGPKNFVLISGTDQSSVSTLAGEGDLLHSLSVYVVQIPLPIRGTNLID